MKNELSFEPVSRKQLREIKGGGSHPEAQQCWTLKCNATTPCASVRCRCDLRLDICIIRI